MIYIGQYVIVTNPGLNKPMIDKSLNPRWFRNEKYYQQKFLLRSPELYMGKKFKVVDRINDMGNKPVLLIRDEVDLLDLFIQEQGVIVVKEEFLEFDEVLI